MRPIVRPDLDGHPKRYEYQQEGNRESVRDPGSLTTRPRGVNLGFCYGLNGAALAEAIP